MVLCLGSSPRALLGWSLGQRESQYRSPEQAEPSCPLGPFHDGWSRELAGIATAKWAEGAQLAVHRLISVAWGSPNQGRARLACSPAWCHPLR